VVSGHNIGTAEVRCAHASSSSSVYKLIRWRLLDHHQLTCPLYLQVESALNSNPNVAESAVVGFPHDVKGNAIYAYVTLSSSAPEGAESDPALHKALKGTVGAQIGRFAIPDVLHFTAGLPKTRSGKIMRRILRKIADPKVSGHCTRYVVWALYMLFSVCIAYAVYIEYVC
jgi:acyl-coenzyme A synthetase/AMP-(fatty) acid ligase